MANSYATQADHSELDPWNINKGWRRGATPQNCFLTLTQTLWHIHGNTYARKHTHNNNDNNNDKQQQQQ